MQAMVMTNYGPPEVLQPAVVDVAAPGPQDVVLRLYATSVNPVDWKVRRGYLKERLPLEFPAVIGWDAAGVVERIGAAVTQFSVGDKVFSRPATDRPGTYAEQVVVGEALVAAKPSNLTFLEAATIPLAGLTAWEALVVIAQVHSGQRVMIHGGAGGVGGYAVQLAKTLGAQVYATASARHHDEVRGLGAAQVIDYQQQDFVQIGPTMDVVLDTVGGDVQTRSFDVLRPGGILVSIAQPPNQTLASSRQVRAQWFFLEPDGHKLAQLATYFADGRMVPRVGEEFALADLREAHRRSEAGHMRGKIGIVIDGAQAGHR